MEWISPAPTVSWPMRPERQAGHVPPAGHRNAAGRPRPRGQIFREKIGAVTPGKQ
ncbi:hypothetical protein GCM10022402_00690 [Salinactinospora qingdaonensis]|uniref:Uncharacterized protein n=1 Tax=Salinactinospora qingdaonensis TaxID=702744 RepID=A0ABP7ESS3_9ACTN